MIIAKRVGLPRLQRYRGDKENTTKHPEEPKEGKED